jgi:polyketide-type polyunsaturated fatty acid synthase PfaA
MSQSTPIAVVGMATLLPGSDDLASFWETVREARDCFSEVPESHWRIEDYFDPTPRAKDKTYGRRGGFIPKIPFDSLKFGLPPAALPSTDVSQILALLIAQRCLADADHGVEGRVDRRRTSVILGGAATTALVSHMSGRMSRPMWKAGLLASGMDEASVEQACDAIADQFVEWQESTFPGLLGNVIAGRIANRFDLGGTNCVLDAACASSLAALSMAMEELRAGRSDTVLSGGVDALNDILMFMCFSQTPALSLTGDCRPFSDRADGTMMGEGLALFALRRFDDALRDGHKVYAVLRGIGASSDGRATSVYAPRAEGQAIALERAYADAGYGPETVELLEAHGTGTVAGDAAEFRSMRTVFGAADPERVQWCALGSVKSQIGHTKAAAGAASLAKTILALHHKVLPATLKVDRPNPQMEVESSPFYLSTQSRPWFRRLSTPRRASVSSFGFGGSNFHVTLEEHTGTERAALLAVGPTHLILLSGADDDGVLAQARDLPASIRNQARLAAHARHSQERFDASSPVRLALLLESADQVGAAVRDAEEALGGSGEVRRVGRALARRGTPADPATVAFVFPGQGSQYVGMGRDLALHFPDAFDVWQAAVERIRDDEADLGDLVFPRPVFTPEDRQAQEARLRATEWAQPGLAAAALAQLALLERVGARPAAALGHSFGELVALHSSGVYDAGTLLDLARSRGRAMAAVAGDSHGDPGTMLAVAGDGDTVRLLLEEQGNRAAVVANDNHPKQVVLSGPTAGIESAAAILTAAGLSHQRLQVAAAFHSELVAPAAARFAQDLAEVPAAAPGFPVMANATATEYEGGAEQVRARLAEQLAHPVRFRECVDALYGLGCRVFVEVGAGAVLTGLVRKCLAEREHVAVALDEPGTHGVTRWWRSMAELATLGLPLDLAALAADATPLDEVPLPPSGATVTAVGGANLGKPYPPTEQSPPPRTHRPLPYLEVRAAAAEPLPELRPESAGHVPSAPSPFLDAAADRPAGTLLAPADEAMTSSVQAQILEAQRLTQQAILDSFAMTLRGLGADAGGGAPVLASRPAPLALAAPAPAAGPNHVAARDVAAVAPPAQPVAQVPRPAPPPEKPAPAPAAAPAPASPAPAEPPSGDLASLVLGVVAEKTGYPAEALEPEMDLESDLGIDSIKRVEILAALSDKVPGLDPTSADPARIRRVKDLLELLEGSLVGPGGPLTR